MHLLTLHHVEDAKKQLQQIGSDPAGVEIMKEKAIFRVIYLSNVQTKAANLIKQTFLAKGGDAAVSRATADLSAVYTDVMVFATLRQYRQALRQLKMQPWGLRIIAEHMEALLREEERKSRNLPEDSEIKSKI